MARKKTSAQLEREIEEALSRASSARVQRDQLERPTPNRVLGRIDHFLSSAQGQIGSHLTNMETKTSSPQVYKIGDELYDDIERLRGKLRKWRP
jgi:hypothetical protein